MSQFSFEENGNLCRIDCSESPRDEIWELVLGIVDALDVGGRNYDIPLGHQIKKLGHKQNSQEEFFEKGLRCAPGGSFSIRFFIYEKALCVSTHNSRDDPESIALLERAIESVFS